MSARILTWVPRAYGSPLGFLVDARDGVVARDIRRRDAETTYARDWPERTVVMYDRDGLDRRSETGPTLRQRLQEQGLL